MFSVTLLPGGVSGGFVPAFSRDQASGVKDYVTHRIREEVGTDG